MDDIIHIVERLGSLGILVLMVWRAPAIIAAIQSLMGSQIEKVSQLQKETLAAFKEQQEAEREVMTLRFENTEKAVERLATSMDATLKSQTVMLQVLNNICEEQGEIRHRLEILEKKP